jgi:hypothetical protein
VRKSRAVPEPSRGAGSRFGGGRGAGAGGLSREYGGVTLPRIAWLITVVICLVASLLLLLSGYLGYAGVLLAIALSAAINLR